MKLFKIYNPDFKALTDLNAAKDVCTIKGCEKMSLSDVPEGCIKKKYIGKLMGNKDLFPAVIQCYLNLVFFVFWNTLSTVCERHKTVLTLILKACC